MLKRGLLTLSLTATLAAPAAAQTAPAADLATAKFTWVWSPGAGPAAFGFNLYCGPAQGSRALHLEIPDPTLREKPVNAIIVSPGDYYCFINAYNAAGDSLPSNTVHFTVGLVPLGPTSLNIQLQ